MKDVYPLPLPRFYRMSGPKSEGQTQLSYVRPPGLWTLLQPPQAVASGRCPGGVQSVRPLLLRRGPFEGGVATDVSRRRSKLNGIIVYGSG